MPEDDASALAKVVAAAEPAQSFNTDLPRQAWNLMQTRYRAAKRAARRMAGQDAYTESPSEDPFEYSYVCDVWTDHVIVKGDYDHEKFKLRVPYTVKAPAAGPEDVVFGEPQLVKQVYVAASDYRNAAEALVIALAAAAAKENT